jgi:hypothetical protein
MACTGGSPKLKAAALLPSSVSAGCVIRSKTGQPARWSAHPAFEEPAGAGLHLVTHVLKGSWIAGGGGWTLTPSPVAGGRPLQLRVR